MSNEFAGSFAWTARLCREKGWQYEVWTGGDPGVLANIRFIAVGRRMSLIDQEYVNAVAAFAASGMSLGEVEDAAPGVHGCLTPTRDAVLEKTNEAFRAKFPRRKLPGRAVAFERRMQVYLPSKRFCWLDTRCSPGWIETCKHPGDHANQRSRQSNKRVYNRSPALHY